MKKPDKSRKKRLAAIKRGKKRSDRLKATQNKKHVRLMENQKQKISAKKKFLEQFQTPGLA